MKKNRVKFGIAILVTSILMTGCVGTFANKPPKGDNPPPRKEESVEENKKKPPKKEDEESGNRYSLEQAMSDNAQLSTIAFSGLAFITGSEGADTFMPPGKVADYFGFQYMRDVDVAGYGHNTQFLTRVANNVLHILNEDQLEKLTTLAVEQASLYTQFAYNRLPLMEAFRQGLSTDTVDETSLVDIEQVGLYSQNLYELDADLSYNRAVVLGEIINSFTEDQIAYLAEMSFNDFNTWPDVEENESLKRSMSHTEFVAVMTYASELFSWYKGSVEADVYFCPERHGTYFGGFFMKDYPAMNNPDYFISTAVTGDKGKMFLDILTDDQRELIESIIDEQKEALKEIAVLRTSISTELRKAQIGETVDKDQVYEWIGRYGQLDGELSALYARRFAQVNSSLSESQQEELVTLRDLDVVPDGSYLFSAPVESPELPENTYLFESIELPDDAGLYTVPDGFEATQKQKGDKPKVKAD